ncbi:DUF4386 domain-containing protein [Dyadobacter frigoris]|uniref:DUF4386 domain-containing protein n=1 Tax=Dyadobacter frigoris TaxID=2576211 RepID=A0A4U6CN32_9BACT|nr:DUF4386 domain-containing protein [Dyadobacter frigoris]TKT84877.1 DUF4386 domain-containing protein [Dyadobacter frigoris]
MATSLKNTARICGFLYLYVIVAGIYSEVFVRGSLIVAGNATATTDNIMTSQSLWRVSFASQIIMLLCTVWLALGLYILLKSVNKQLSMAAMLFNLVSIAIESLTKLLLLAVLYLLDDYDYLRSFEPAQLRTLAYLSIRLHAAGYNIALAFFGVNCLFWGHLIFKSPHFSKILGVMLVITGLCYMINSFSWFIDPSFAAKIFPAVLVPCLVGELSLAFWLLFKPVRSEVPL